MTVLMLKPVTQDEHTLIGELLLPGGEHLCYTVENRKLAIPMGAYAIGPHSVEHGSPPVPSLEVTHVPGRTNILLHVANTYDQLLGCIAPNVAYGGVGTAAGLAGGGSHKAMQLVLDAKPTQIIVIRGPVA
jgi:hypothetical protein